MSDARELFVRYLDQRVAMGEGSVYLTDPLRPVAGRSDTSDGVRSDENAAPPRRTPAAGPGGKVETDPAVPGWMRDAPQIPPAGMVIPRPSTDLFSEDSVAAMDLDEITAAVRECVACPLHAGRAKAVPGEGPRDARLVVVGEGPGKTEDETGRPFVGRAGELLNDILKAIDLPRDRVFICNVVKCRPPNNRKPAGDEIESCMGYLYRQLEIIRPAVILAMGGTAAETLLGTRQSLGSLRNKVHEFRGIPLVVTYHPAALLRNPNWKKPTWDDVRIARQLVEHRR